MFEKLLDSMAIRQVLEHGHVVGCILLRDGYTTLILRSRSAKSLQLLRYGVGKKADLYCFPGELAFLRHIDFDLMPKVEYRFKRLPPHSVKLSGVHACNKSALVRSDFSQHINATEVVKGHAGRSQAP